MTDQQCTLGAAPDGSARVMLVRHAGRGGGVAGVAHLLPLPLAQRRQGNLAVLYCGAVLPVAEIQAVEQAGQGTDTLVCAPCHTAHAAGEPPAPASGPGVFANPSLSGRIAAGRAYVDLGLSILLQDGQVRLDLDDGAVAIGLPEALAAEVTDVLLTRRCSPAVLRHPGAPAYQVFVVTERFPVTLGWPPMVCRLTSGSVPLPPSRTSDGRVTWIRPPVPGAAGLCREIDIVAALRTVQQNAKPGSAMSVAP